MKKILLINPPLYFFKGDPRAIDVSVPPLGLLYLASYINKYSRILEASVLDVAADNFTLDKIRVKVSNFNPFVVGITSMTPQLQGAVELAKFLKKNFRTKFKIFLGGSHVSADPNFVNRFSDIFDYTVTGEAEKTFMESVEKLSRGQKIPRIQAGEVITDLDTIPFPDKKLINREKYSQHESMMFSRGCPYHCYYCSRPAISRKVRYRSTGNMIREIKSCYEYCHGQIDFQDDTFNLDKNRVQEFCLAVQQEKLKLKWRCNARIDLMDEELLLAMKKAGCELIHFGIEAGNERIRQKVVNKGKFTNKQIYEVMSLCKKHSIKFAGYFMIGHPTESKKNLEETRQMILKSGIDLLGLSIPTPFPGSKLYDIACQNGIISDRIIDTFAEKKLGEGYVGNYPVFVPTSMTKEYLYSYMKEINRKFYINIKTFWKQLRQDVTSFKKIKKDIFDLLSLILRGVSSRKSYVNIDKKKEC